MTVLWQENNSQQAHTSPKVEAERLRDGFGRAITDLRV